MKEVKQEDINYTEVTLVSKEKAEAAIKKGARWAFDNLEFDETRGYLECLSDLGLI